VISAFFMKALKLVRAVSAIKPTELGIGKVASLYHFSGASGGSLRCVF